MDTLNCVINWKIRSLRNRYFTPITLIDGVLDDIPIYLKFSFLEACEGPCKIRESSTIDYTNSGLKFYNFDIVL